MILLWMKKWQYPKHHQIRPFSACKIHASKVHRGPADDTLHTKCNSIIFVAISKVMMEWGHIFIQRNTIWQNAWNMIWLNGIMFRALLVSMVHVLLFHQFSYLVFVAVWQEEFWTREWPSMTRSGSWTQCSTSPDYNSYPCPNFKQLNLFPLSNK